MASPFRIFRKHQKALLVVAGVILMFVFVIGDSLMQYIGSGMASEPGESRRPGQVAVRWDGGELTNAELWRLVTQRMVVNTVVRNVEYVGRAGIMQAGGEPQPLRVEMIVGPESPQDGVERDVVRARIFADAARAAGMTVSDQYIVDYLQQLGRGYVPIEAIRQIISQVQVGGRPATVDFVLAALREEILARNYLASYMFALDTVMPEQRWQDWLNVNDRVVVEAAAIPVESFVVDVPDPGDAELAEFYDQYKQREPQPDRTWGIELPSPHPGFARPRKVELQYLKADFNDFLAKVEDEITDEEIEKFYEDNKDPYFVSAESLLGAEPAAEGEGRATGDQTTPPADDAAAPPAPAEDDQSSHDAAGKRGVFRLAAFQADEPAAEAEAPAAPSPDESGSEAAPDVVVEPPAADAAEATEEPKKYQPLDEVRDEIRRIIAEAKVSERLESLMTELQHALNEHYTSYFGASLDAEAAGKPVPPPPPELADLSPLAEKHGLSVEKVGPVSFLELRELPVGLSARPDVGNMPLIMTVFGREMELYQPITSFDLDNNRYLTMKTRDTPGSVPELAEVRDDVVRAYKLQKAADLALSHATELASKVELSGRTVEDYFADDPKIKVTKTDPFAYLTIGEVSRDTRQVQSFRLSAPEGLSAAGPELMETVFTLKDGEVGAALNHPQSIAYVLQIVEHQDSEAELRQAFLSEADTWYGIPAMARDRAKISVRVLMDDMLESANVDWQRDPDIPIREEEADADATSSRGS